MYVSWQCSTAIGGANCTHLSLTDHQGLTWNFLDNGTGEIYSPPPDIYYQVWNVGWTNNSGDYQDIVFGGEGSSTNGAWVQDHSWRLAPGQGIAYPMTNNGTGAIAYVVDRRTGDTLNNFGTGTTYHSQAGGGVGLGTGSVSQGTVIPIVAAPHGGGGSTNLVTQADIHNLGAVLALGNAGMELRLASIQTNTAGLAALTSLGGLSNVNVGGFASLSNQLGGVSNGLAWVNGTLNGISNLLSGQGTNSGNGSNVWVMNSNLNTMADIAAVGWSNALVGNSNLAYWSTNSDGIREFGDTNWSGIASNFTQFDQGSGLTSVGDAIVNGVQSGEAGADDFVIDLGQYGKLDLKRALSLGIFEESQPLGQVVGKGLKAEQQFTSFIGVRSWIRQLMLWGLVAGLLMWTVKRLREAVMGVFHVNNLTVSDTAGGALSQIPLFTVTLRGTITLVLLGVILTLPAVAVTVLSSVMFFITGTGTVAAAVAHTASGAATVASTPSVLWNVWALFNFYLPIPEAVVVGINYILLAFGIDINEVACAVYYKFVSV